MKKIILGLAVVAMAAATSAFTTLEKQESAKNLVDYYWYTREAPDEYSEDVHASEPSSQCMLSATELCAKGFLSPQDAEEITDLTEAEDRFKNSQ